MHSFYILASALVANLLAQGLKLFSYKHKTGDWIWRSVLSSGGFPSSHTSAVVGMSTAIGLQCGFESPIFSLSLVTACIVMYDACHVRWYCGKGLEITQELIDDLENSGVIEPDDKYHQKLMTVLGHKVSEICGGFVIGVAVAVALFVYMQV